MLKSNERFEFNDIFMTLGIIYLTLGSVLFENYV